MENKMGLDDFIIEHGAEAVFQLPTMAPPPPSHPLTELGNAERFAAQHKDLVRYVSAWRKWIFYDGRRWKIGADDHVRRLAHETVRSLYHLAAQAADTDTAQKLAKWAATSCRSAAITALLKEAAALLAIDSEELDANPWLFNCWNCTIDLKNGNARSHRKEDFITRISPVEFRPEATAPLFEKILNTCLRGNQELIDYVQRLAGYSMSGSTREQCIFIFFGEGANGKSTFLNALMGALGEYAQTTRPETLMAKRDCIPSDIAKLKGAHLVVAAEAEDGHQLAESQIKQMTGGEKIQARALYQDWFEFTPEFKIILCTNHKPVIKGDDHAIWRRIRLVPFDVTIPEHERDKDLPEKLRGELEGILTWIVAGAATWLLDGLGNPVAVQQATENYQTEQNVLNNFLDSCCTVKLEATVEAGQLFQGFERWRMCEGHRKVTQTKFGRMMGFLGFDKKRNSTGRVVYHGIGLNSC